MKKLFGGINLTWKKLIIFSVIVAIYTAVMAIIPVTQDTSFRDISATLEWWILFGVIIIYNSKSNLDSALKCFVFFFFFNTPIIITPMAAKQNIQDSKCCGKFDNVLLKKPKPIIDSNTSIGSKIIILNILSFFI